MLRTERLIDSISKETLAKLIFNKHAERLMASKRVNSSPKKEAQMGDLGQLDFDDYIRFCCGYRQTPNHKYLEGLSNGNILHKITPDNWKLFVLVASGASFHQVNEPWYYDIISRSQYMYPQQYFSTIDKDIHRTMPASCLQSEQLRNVLYTYAIRNPNLTYCQGLNFVVANFLTSGMSEQESFWLLTCLVEEILPFDYYINLKPIVCLNSLFNDSLKEINPSFALLCQKINLETSFFFVSWLVTLYGKGFSKVLSEHILVLIVLEKEIGLIKAGLTLVKILEGKLPVTEEFSAILKVIQALQPLLGVEEFQKEYQKIYINPELFYVYLSIYMEEYPKDPPHSPYKRRTTKHKGLAKCNPEYTVCLHVLEVERECRYLKETQTLRIKKPLDELVVTNYFDKNHCCEKKTRVFLPPQLLEQVKIGRHTHICTHEGSSKIKISPQEIQEQPEKEIDFEQLIAGSVTTRQLGPQKSQIFYDLSNQFQMIQIIEDEEISEEIEMKRQQDIIRRLSSRDIQIEVGRLGAVEVIRDFIPKIFKNDRT